jgi:hypothetical protein
LGSCGFDVKRVERLARCHEQPVLLFAAEAEVCARGREVYPPDQDAIRGITVDTVISFASPARSGPDVAIQIRTDAIGKAFSHIYKESIVFKPVRGDVEDADVGWMVGAV